MAVRRAQGEPGAAAGTISHVPNIKVVSDKDAPNSSSSAILLDDVHVTRVADFVGGLGITTTTLANGRGVGLEVDAGEAGLVTTATIRTKAGHPLEVTSATANYVDIGTTGGTHTVWNGLTFTTPNVLGTTFTACEGGGSPTPDAPPTPLVVVAPETSVPTYDPCEDIHDTFYRQSDAIMDLYAWANGALNLRVRLNAGGMTVFTPTFADTFYGLTFNALGGEIGTTGLECNGPLQVSGLTYLQVGNPSGGSLAWNPPGAVSGIYGLFQDDVHALDTVYGSQAVVVGLGRQKHNNSGWLWIASEGSGSGVPTAGSQESAVFSSSRGLNFQNHGAWNQGSVSSAFWFDDAIRAAKDIDTSASVNAANDVIATDLVQGADVAATDDATVGDDLTVTGDTATATLDITSANKSGTGTITGADLGVISTTISGAWSTSAVIVCSWASGQPWLDDLPENAGQLTAVVTGSGTATVVAYFPTLPQSDVTFNYRVID